MKRMLGALLAILMTFSALPLCTQASAPGRRQISANTIIDTDGSDGYTGDYVVVYNPSEDPENWLTTGDMEGRIETSLECPAPAAGFWNDGSYLIDVDAQMAEKAREAGAALPKAAEAGAVRRSFEVGDTHTFVILNYSPAGIFVEFKVLAKGEHCYIWTPVSNAENVYPLDSIDPSFALGIVPSL